MVPFFLLGSYADSPSKVIFAGEKSYPKVTGWWAVNPDIIICKDSRLKKTRVKNALSYWKKLGYTFNNVRYEDDFSRPCLNGPFYGEIVITMPSQSFDFKKLALARVTKDKDTAQVLYVKIEIQTMANEKERVLEHEIGHALGWQHTFRSYHMMNEHWQLGGFDSAGLNYKRYGELVNDLVKP